ncbi:MAG: hypothetical protein DWQ01_17735 [Planctomycetota bacterium]|nr:MAG: hypothetical protein DWQ01_17735 [Planctomycetota bacterium]
MSPFSGEPSPSSTPHGQSAQRRFYAAYWDPDLEQWVTWIISAETARAAFIKAVSDLEEYAELDPAGEVHGQGERLAQLLHLLQLETGRPCRFAAGVEPLVIVQVD